MELQLSLPIYWKPESSALILAGGPTPSSSGSNDTCTAEPRQIEHVACMCNYISMHSTSKACMITRWQPPPNLSILKWTQANDAFQSIITLPPCCFSSWKTNRAIINITQDSRPAFSEIHDANVIHIYKEAATPMYSSPYHEDRRGSICFTNSR